MDGYSFICNGCLNQQSDKCENCKGRGREWEPSNKDFYEKDPKKYMEYLILSSS